MAPSPHSAVPGPVAANSSHHVHPSHLSSSLSSAPPDIDPAELPPSAATQKPQSHTIAPLLASPPPLQLGFIHRVDVSHLRDILQFKSFLPVASGAFGQVFPAKLRANGQDVAVKFPTVQPGREDVATRLILWETRVLKEVNEGSSHPNVIAFIVDCCVAERLPCLLMSFEPLGSLLHFMAEPKPNFTTDIKWNTGLQVARGILHIKNAGWLHRDIKTANLLVSEWTPGESLTIKIGDFGFARRINDIKFHRSSLAGTPPFRAPERTPDYPSRIGGLLPESFTPEDACKGDVYSLGVTIRCLLKNMPNPAADWDPAADEPQPPLEKRRYRLVETTLIEDPAKRCTIEEFPKKGGAMLGARIKASEKSEQPQASSSTNPPDTSKKRGQGNEQRGSDRQPKKSKVSV